jgi:hypothetical protein
VFWREALNDYGAFASLRSLYPYAGKVYQDQLLFRDRGMASPTHRFFGVLPEFIGFGHDLLPTEWDVL